MSAGFSDLLNALGLWLGGRKSSQPAVTDIVATVTLTEWPLNTALTELPTIGKETASLIETAVVELASAVTEAFSPLNVSVQETAVIR